MITSPNGHADGEYKRYLITESGVSPRAIPGVPGYTHVVSSDEHDEDGVLISDMYTNATKRRAMMEKRMRKEQGIAAAVAPPRLQGPKDADVTLIGWGSTQGVIEEARAQLAAAGNYRQSAADSLARPAARRSHPRQLRNAKRTIIVENNYSGQFAALSAQRNQLRRRRPHPQVRWRAFHAAPHCGSGPRTTRRRHTGVRPDSRNHGLGETVRQLLTKRRSGKSRGPTGWE